jgi:hypothetical protein
VDSLLRIPRVVGKRGTRGFVGCSAVFGFVVTQKVAAQAVPLVGAPGGAAVNYAFIRHFTVRRLERLCGKERIRSEYDLIAGQL